MRIRVFAYSVFLIAASAGSVKTLAASPDCARWVREYQQGLAKRAAIAKKHVVHAALYIPRPARKQKPLAHLRPVKLSPQEMLKRFRVLCGDDLPSEPVDVSFVPTNLEAMLLPPVAFPDAAPVTDIANPVPFTPQPAPPVIPTTPTQVTSSGGTPVIPSGPTVPVVNVPSPVPEPSSLVLLLTGALGAVPLIKRRLS